MTMLIHVGFYNPAYEHGGPRAHIPHLEVKHVACTMEVPPDIQSRHKSAKPLTSIEACISKHPL